MNVETRRTWFASTVRQEEMSEGECRRLAREIIDEWKAGATPDARAALSQHVALRKHKAVAMDLVYEEFCLRVERGEQLSVERFCQRFPDHKRSVWQQLEIHRLIDDNPEFLPAFTREQWPENGDSIQGFTVIEELGRGAFARVYLAEDEKLGRRMVAIKVSWHAEDEADTLGKLDHKNIVPVYSVQHDDASGLTVICMPFLGRTTLTDVIDKISSTPQSGTSEQHIEMVLRTGLAIAEALAYAHSRDVLHLDLKPSNILITAGGRPQLLDFNLSRDRAKKQSRVGGTLPYMSPEQLDSFVAPGSAAEPNERSDIYALGVVLIELLTGELPGAQLIEKGVSQEIAKELLSQRTREPLVRGAERSSVLHMIARAVAFDPDDRFEDADQFAAALRRELTIVPRIRRWLKTRPWIARVASLTAALLIVAGIAYAALLPPREDRMFARGVTAFDRQDYQTAATYLSDTLTHRPDWTEARLLRAQAYIQLGEFRKAATDLEDLPQPQSSELLGYCCYQMGSKGEAFQHWDKAVSAGSRNAAVYNNLGHWRLSNNHLSHALEKFDSAIELDRTLQAAHINRALTHQLIARDEQRSPQEALADIHQALKLGPPSQDLLLWAASITYEASKYDQTSLDEAVDLLRQAKRGGATQKSIDGYPGLDELTELLPNDDRQSSGSDLPRSTLLILNPIPDRSTQ